MLIPTSIHIAPRQENKIMRAYEGGTGCHIKAKKMTTSGKHKILLTPAQFKKYYETKNGKVVSLPFRHEHLIENMKHTGGFLPLLAAALAPIIGGVAGGLIEKEIAGSGIYQQGCRKKKTGSGMYLNPYMSRKRARR
jgi:hypothetical protein